MLTIRRAQVEAFAADALRRFEWRSIAHLRALAPQHCALLDDAALGSVARLGLARAAGHGLTTRGPVRLFLDLMVMLGSDFDSDPQYPWVRTALDPATAADPMARAERLHAATMAWRADVIGADDVHERAALQRAAELRHEDWPTIAAAPAAAVARRLAALYPEKARALGAAPLQELVDAAAALGARRAPAAPGATPVLAGLMFALGHGVASDPQFPWVAATLDDAGGDPALRAERLFRRAVAYFGTAARR